MPDDKNQNSTLELPDHTRAQIAALVQAILAVAAAFGLDLTQEQSVALIALSGVLGTVLMTADAAIRRGRAQNADKLVPRGTITARQGETEVTAEVTAGAGATQSEVTQFLTLLQQFLRDSGLVLQPAPPNGGDESTATTSTKRAGAQRRPR